MGGADEEAAFGGVPELTWIKAITTATAATTLPIIVQKSVRLRRIGPPRPSCLSRRNLASSVPGDASAPPTQRCPHHAAALSSNRGPRGTAGPSRCGACQWSDGRIGHDRLVAAVTGCGGSLMSRPARPVARRERLRRACRGSDGARLLAVAPARARGSPGRGSAGRWPSGERWSGPVSPGTRSTRQWPGSGLSRSTGSAGGRRSIWLRICRVAFCPFTTAPR